MLASCTAYVREHDHTENEKRVTYPGHGCWMLCRFGEEVGGLGLWSAFRMYPSGRFVRKGTNGFFAILDALTHSLTLSLIHRQTSTEVNVVLYTEDVGALYGATGNASCLLYVAVPP